MARNIEIKARIDSVEKLASKAAQIADGPPVEILQDDTFFKCAAGRLKLRAFVDGTGELIFYRRADAQGPKESFYVISKTQEPDSLRETLSLAYGEVGRVHKHRTLFLAGRTRIHLDRVVGLGDFMELEVVLDEGEAAASGVSEAHALMAALGVSDSQLIEGAYLDLLAKAQAAATSI